MKKGLFITFEGTDGVGKSTHLRRLANWLRRQGRAVRVTREPGGDDLGDRIRELILNPRHDPTNRAELLLYEAARAQHVERVIKPALRRGETVLCDRFIDATVAYQSFGRGFRRSDVDWLNRFATDGLKPDVTILLERPVAAAMAGVFKRRGRGASGDRMERAGASFQEKVRKGYRALARTDRRITPVAVSDDRRRTQEEIRAIVAKRIKA